ncbi:tRNA pseudouridine(55) synthase TruB [Ruminococcus flavefaciens]|uniref:tRNA pseudouridine(55) synthase TruB n=1 Tax=Ruminococcus flavefaciens TaxID=1265 RepID=UPI0026F117CC|nr:tRNA pseudouridine(55) synthase TruB [Ruminococcus flavefaciens]MDD7517048.1 tRNA pseudouridine(55) synthase TruB [Ruminococcus flavefaciens]MDY5692135.1 tRNA pseudouridine(55) synthase TruB [Ruminococcus flavefaciens]
MNGILCVNKPQDFTSFDVVAKLRGILQMKRLGHGGTLDPMATGVLPVFVGNATKACDIMPDNNKSYRAGFRFGAVSDTQDIWGEVTERSDMSVEREAIEAVIPEFTGKIMQLPPMYSAVQVGGKRLYDLARQGIEVERQAREIEVTALVLEEYDSNTREGVLSIACGKGTYIRTIISDIGERLGCGGIMTSLVRTSSGGFGLDDCFTLEEIQKAKDEDRLEELILPIERVFEKLPKLRLGEAQTRMYRNGVKLDLSKLRGIREGEECYGVYGFDGGFIGTAFADLDGGILRVGKNLG